MVTDTSVSIAAKLNYDPRPRGRELRVRVNVRLTFLKLFATRQHCHAVKNISRELSRDVSDARRASVFRERACPITRRRKLVKLSLSTTRLASRSARAGNYTLITSIPTRARQKYGRLRVYVIAKSIGHTISAPFENIASCRSREIRSILVTIYISVARL